MMAEAPVLLDPNTRAMLQRLADIVTPEPVSWLPQTVGWAVLGGALLAVVVWLTASCLRRYRANRYRREALAILDQIDAMLADRRFRKTALVAIPVLIKRVALGGWPRPEVAALSGTRWVSFLQQHAGGASFSDEAAVLLSELEYRNKITEASADDARRFTAAARAWIGGHVVSA